MAKLEAGALVADIGCGHGASTILMAQAFPNSRFVAIDYHVESIEIARRRAEQAGVADRVTFEVAGAADLPGSGYDLVAFFDSLHDLGDPLAAARRASAALAPDGVCMIVEPLAGDSITDNINPVSRYFYGMSTLVCTPGSLSQPGQAGLGTQAGEARLAEVLIAGGFGTRAAGGRVAAEHGAGSASALTVTRAAARAAARVSAHPHLVEQRDPQRAVLVVARAFGQQHDGPPVEQRNGGRRVGDVRVGVLPARAGLRTVRGECRVDAPLEAAIAEPGEVGAVVAGE